MKNILYVVFTVILMTSCHKGIFISVLNKTNSVTTVRCYYGKMLFVDTIYLEPNDSFLLRHYMTPFISWKKIPDRFISYMDSVTIQTNESMVVYRTKEDIYNLLINGKDTTSCIKFRIIFPLLSE